MRVFWLRQALSSRNEQILYIATDNSSAALRQDELIEQCVLWLQAFPHMGKFVSSTHSYQLVIADTPFILWYRIVETRIEIYRFAHGRQRR